MPNSAKAAKSRHIPCMGRAFRKDATAGVILRNSSPHEATRKQVEDLLSFAEEEESYHRMRAAQKLRALLRNMPSRDLSEEEKQHVENALFLFGVQMGESKALEKSRSLQAKWGGSAEQAVAMENWNQALLALSRYEGCQLLLEVMKQNGCGDMLEDARNTLRSEQSISRLVRATQFAEMFVASRGAKDVAATEELLARLDDEIQDCSELPGRRNGQQHLVVSSERIWMRNWSEGVLGSSGQGTSGWVSEAEMPIAGTGRLSALVASEALDEKELLPSAVHESIHLNQEHFNDQSIPEGWGSFEANELLEGMTEGLTLLRLKKSQDDRLRDVCHHSANEEISDTAYSQEVASLFRILEQAGTEKAAIAAELAALQTLPLPKAVNSIEKRLGKELLPL